MNTEEFSNQSSSPSQNNEETVQPTRVKLSADDLEHFSKEEIVKCWLDQDKYLDTVVEKNHCPNDKLEERYRQQLADAARRENLLVMRLTTKEQEMQDLLNQVNELKATQTPSLSALRSHLLDPAVNLMLDKLKRELDATKTKLEETQNELSAWKFTPDSNTGKRLMAKCRMLYQENEELGKMISSGRLAKLEGDLALQKNFSEEMKKSQTELDEVLQELDEDMEGMQSTILHLQQQLREYKEQINNLSQENDELRQHAKLSGHQLSDEKQMKDNDNLGSSAGSDSETAKVMVCDPPGTVSWTPQQNGHSGFGDGYLQENEDRLDDSHSYQNFSEGNSDFHHSESDDENIGSKTVDSMDESSQSELVSSSKDQALNPCDQATPSNALNYESSIGNSIDGVSCDEHHNEDFCRTSSINSEPDQPDSSNCKPAQDNILSSAIVAEPDSQPAGSASLHNHKRTTRSSNSKISESTVTSAEKDPVSSTNTVRKRTIYETGDSHSDSLPRRSKRTRTEGNGGNLEPDDGSGDILSNGMQSSPDE